MTKKEHQRHLADAMHWANKAYEHAEEGNLPAMYTFALMARESLHKSVRDYNATTREEKGAA